MVRTYGVLRRRSRIGKEMSDAEFEPLVVMAGGSVYGAVGPQWASFRHLVVALAAIVGER